MPMPSLEGLRGVGAVFEGPLPCSVTTLQIIALSRASAMASRADIGAHVWEVRIVPLGIRF